MDAKDQGEKVTAEQVKDLVRRYAEQEHPGEWARIGVLILVGPPGEEEQERLLVRRATPAQDPGQQG